MQHTIMETDETCPDLSVLDFRPVHPCNYSQNLTACEEEWPCEFRKFWLEIHPFVTLTRVFLSSGSLVIIFVGVVLNVLSFYILLSSGLSKNGSGVYLIGLAVCDSGTLITNILIGVVRGNNDEFNGYFMDHEWLCRSHGVFVELFQTISAWIVVAFTVERSLAVWCPMLFRQRRNRRAKIVVSSLGAIFFLFCLSKLFLTGFERDSVFGYTACPSHRLIWEGMSYMRIAFQTWIPTIIVFSFNCLMFWKLRRIRIHRKQLTAHLRQSQLVNISHPHSLAPRNQSFIRKPNLTNPMLIAVSLAYLVLVCPLGAVQTVELHWKLHHSVPVSAVEPGKSAYVKWLTQKILLRHIRAFFFAFYQLNFSINFFLYFAAGVEFRRHLLKKLAQVSSFMKRRLFCYCTEGPAAILLNPTPHYLQATSSSSSNATTATTCSTNASVTSSGSASSNPSLFLTKKDACAAVIIPATLREEEEGEEESPSNDEQSVTNQNNCNGPGDGGETKF